VIFIANPRAGAGQGRTLWPLWQGELQKYGLPQNWHICQTADEALRQARRAREPVVAVGGDGTVNYVINGLMMSGGQVPLGVLPAGSSADFCRCHEIPVEKSAAVSTLAGGRTRPLDLAEARLTGGGSEMAACYFSCGARLCVGAGSSGDICGPGHGYLGRLAAACQHKPFKCYLTLDEEKFEFSQTDYLMFFKNPILAQALNLPEAAGGADGRLTALLFHNLSKIRLAQMLALLAGRKPLPRTAVFARAFTRARLVNDSKLPVEFEGTPIGFTPMELELRPGVLDVIVPPA
jgi:diacylglycerol kinase family enzyme